jgi:GNAT superfamily N-acetyltransferase
VSDSIRISEVEYKVGNDLDLDAVIELYRDSTLGERRPIEDRERMLAMVQNANLVVTAWDKDLLVGISRAISDFSFVTYLSDLAVRKSYQKRGIGTELIRRTQIESGSKILLVLLSAPAAEKFYPHVGFTHHPQAWILNPENAVR